MNSFNDTIKIIGVNPYVVPPDRVLQSLFKESGRSAGPIPIRGRLNGHPYIQTLVKFQGMWRLYLNLTMRKEAGIDVGDTAEFTVEFDPRSRDVEMPKELERALRKNSKARAVFESLPPSRQKEINRYIAKLKDPDVVKKNVLRAVDFLCGKGRFAGRDNP